MIKAYKFELRCKKDYYPEQSLIRLEKDSFYVLAAESHEASASAD